MPKMIITFLFPVILLSCLVFRGCGERSQECMDVIDVPREQGYAKFETYPIEKQLDVYLCAMNVEPPDLGLADLIAKRGESAIPIVLQKLKTAKREIDQEDIIYLLEVMSDRGLLRDRKDVIADISDVIESMKISQSRQSSLERLKKIQINSGVKPFTYVQ
jgi:hypothetical protein